MTTERDFKRFLAIATIVILIATAACAGFVAFMDPYRLYDSKARNGLNRIKPMPMRYQNEIKLHGAVKRRASTVILGNSRAELGFNPEDFESDSSAYNLALAGTRLATARSQLDYLNKEGVVPARLVVGVEFLDFLFEAQKASSQLAAQPKTALDDLAWRADALFSIDSVIDSLKTLRLQRASYPQSITADGFNPLLEYDKFARDAGYYAIFQQRAVDYAKRFVRAPHSRNIRWPASSPDVVALRAIIAHGSKEGADVHLVIYPYHVQIMAMLEEAGLIGTFDSWKAMLVGEISTALATNPGARVTLWDFSGYSRYQCEAIPAKGDTHSQTRWYWEAGHFKETLGQIMLYRMFGRTDKQMPQPLGFELNGNNIVSNQSRISRERAGCFAAQQGIFTDAGTLISEARRLERNGDEGGEH